MHISGLSNESRLTKGIISIKKISPVHTLFLDKKQDLVTLKKIDSSGDIMFH